MTTEELHEVLKDRHADIGNRLDDIKDLIKAQNGRVTKLEDSVTGLKVADGIWAGGILGIMGLLKLLWK